MKQSVNKNEVEALKKEGFNDELINKLFRKERSKVSFTVENTRQYAIKVLAVISNLEQNERKRVLLKALEKNKQ